MATKKRKAAPATLIMRKLRVIYTDPDATESSSEEEEEYGDPVGCRTKKIKRVVTEIPFPLIPVEKSPTREGKTHHRQKKAAAEEAPSRCYTGVRQRKWGRWSAEIRNPIKKERVWLGTYNTAEEAADAYRRMKLEYQRQARPEKPTNEPPSPATSPAAAVDQQKSSSFASPFSVLDLIGFMKSMDKKDMDLDRLVGLLPIQLGNEIWMWTKKGAVVDIYPDDHRLSKEEMAWVEDNMDFFCSRLSHHNSWLTTRVPILC